MNPDPNQDLAHLSDDDVAAALGFATTLSEPLLPQDEMDTEEDEGVETADESPETEEAAEADIRAQLEDLLAKENDTETEDTETAG